MQTFRVHDAVDDLIDDLVTRATDTLADIDLQMERLQATRQHIEAMVAGVRGTPQATVNGPKQAPKLSVVQADTVTCPHCDATSTPHGLKVHIARKHRPSFDQQAARNAAAAAI